MIRIALDAMGGDNAPDVNIDGALMALKENEEIELVLVGQEDVIKAYLAGKEYDSSRIEIRNATEVIDTGEPPVQAVQKKKDSSLVVGMKMLKEKEADAFISCGSTGALLVAGQVIAGRLKGVKRAPLGVIVPSTAGETLIIDCGANMDAKPENLVQFAVIGSLYMQQMRGIENPRVGLVNIGTEEEKGNQLTRETYQLLKDVPGINYIGNVEARDIPLGGADVCVCDAFCGNIVLKMYEGTAKALLSQIKGALMSSVSGKLGGLLIKPSLKKLMATFSGSENGGAPMLGLNGLVVKAHGNSDANQVRNAILQSIDFSKNNVNEKIVAAIAALDKEKEEKEEKDS